MSFRSLLADLLLGGNLANAYTLAGTITAGTVNGLSVVIDGARLAIFYYDATGALVLSLAPAAGTDSYGHPYPAGLGIFSGGTLLGVWDGNAWSIGESGQGQIRAVVASLIPSLQFTTPNPNIGNSASISATQVGFGAAGFDEFDIEAPTDTTNTEQWLITVRSASQDGTQRGQVLVRLNQGGTIVNVLSFDFGGAHMLGAVTAVQPGTGTPATPAVAETWHDLALNAGFSGGVAGTAVPRYQKESIGGGRTRLSGGVALTANQPQNTAIGTLDPGYRPLNDLYINTANNLSGGATNIESLHIKTTGDIELGVSGSNGNYVMLDGVSFPLD